MADHLPPVVAKLGADLSDFQRGMTQAKSEMAGVADSGGAAFGRLRAAAQVAFTAIAVGAVAVGGALTAIGAFGLKAAADMQQVQVAFEGILGSKDAATSFLDSLQQFANRTPFEFSDLAEAAKMLMATGTAADQVIPVMTTLGNVAATLGVGADGINSVVRALGQMQGKGKASAEELQQISEAMPGFSAIGAIAESMGISVGEAFDLMAQGAIPADQAIQAILAGMERFPGAAGAMERQSQTLNGVLSTLKDTLKTNLVEGLTPILPAITGALGGIQGALGQAIEGVAGTLGQLIPPLLGLAEPVLGILSGLLGSVGTIFASVAVQLQDVFAALGPVAQPFFDMLANLGTSIAQALGPVLANLLPPLVNLITVIGNALTPVINALAPVLAKVSEALGGVINKLAASGVFERLSDILVKVLDALEPVGDMLIESFLRAFEELQPAIPPVLDALEALIPLLPPLAELSMQWTLILLQLTPVLTQIIIVLAELTAAIAPVVAAVLQFASAWISGGWDWVIGVIKDLAHWVKDELGPAFVTGFDAVKGAVSDAWAAIQPALDPIVAAMRAVGDAGQWLIDHAPEAWSILQGAVKGAWEVISPALSPLRAGIDGVASAMGWFVDHAGEAWGILQGAISAAWGVVEPMVSTLRAVLGGIVNAMDWMIGHAAEAWSALSGAVSSAFGAVYDAMLVPLGAVLGLVRSSLEVIKDVAGTAWSAFQDAITTAWGAVEGPLGHLADALGTIRSVLDRIAELAGNAKRKLEDLGNVKLPVVGSPGNLLPDFTPGFDIPGAPFMDSGGIIPGPTGAPRPIIGHGDEVIFNPGQQAQLLWAIANGAGGGGGGVTVVIVQSLDEALGYVPDAARADTQAAFLRMRG